MPIRSTNWNWLVLNFAPFNLDILSPIIGAIALESFIICTFFIGKVNNDLQFTNTYLGTLTLVKFDYIFCTLQNFRMAEGYSTQNMEIFICAIHANNIGFFFYHNTHLAFAKHLNFLTEQFELECISHIVTS